MEPNNEYDLLLKSFPPAFSDRMKQRLGAEAPAFFEALQGSPVISVRYNDAKMQRSGTADPVPWCRLGAYLSSRPVFALDPFWHAGGYYVQEASSMFLEQAVLQLGLQERPVTALDLCAAP